MTDASTTAGTRPAPSGHGRALRAQVRFEVTTFLREPTDLFFSAALPVLFLVIFTSIFGDDPVTEGSSVTIAQQMVPGFVAFALVASGFTSMALNLVFKRERGMLKRIRITPVPMWVVFGGLVGRVLLTSTTVTLVLLAVGRAAFGVSLPLAHVPLLLAALLLGSIALCCLGVAATALVRNEDAAPAITNAIVLPLFFVSGVFIPSSQLPDGLRIVGEAFPVEPLVAALVDAFDPGSVALGPTLRHLGVLAAWGAVGLVVASRTFRTVPERDRE